LTNFQTVRKSLDRLKEIEQMKDNGIWENLKKKEIASLTKEKDKLLFNFGGVREMKKKTSQCKNGDRCIVSTCKKLHPIRHCTNQRCNEKECTFLHWQKDGTLFRQLVACEGVSEEKLEQRIVGNDVVDGAGKTIDAFLKTKGSISKVLFCEIKTHHPDLLIENYDRPGVYVPGKELRGAVAQVQKTIHKMTMKITDYYHRHEDKEGNPMEDLLFIKPRGIVVIGQLSDFKVENGINYEKLSSFELYRQQVSGIEILTYDELYQRAKFIIED